jgi:hypothetical protein
LRTTGLVAGAVALGVTATESATAGKPVANGWYEEEEIYYIANGVEEGVTDAEKTTSISSGGSEVPGTGRGVHPWRIRLLPPNVNIVRTASRVTVDKIVDSSHVSDHYPEALFDDVADILGARDAGLVTIQKPGVVVHCPHRSRKGGRCTRKHRTVGGFPVAVAGNVLIPS